ncbi:TPA: reverse transcriptase domain-containing protein, partial [Streptococcus suis]
MKEWTEFEIEEYRKQLIKKGVPVIFDLEHLRRLIGFEKNKFYKIFYKLEYQYREIKIPKRKKGEFRVLSVPSRNLKMIQRWILDNILYAIPCSDNATGFVPLRSVSDNAVPHLGHKYIYKFDLRDFFPSITKSKVFFLFKDMGYTNELSNALALLCSFNNALPQGGPTSPYIANLLCKRLDLRINN